MAGSPRLSCSRGLGTAFSGRRVHLRAETNPAHRMLTYAIDKQKRFFRDSHDDRWERLQNEPISDQDMVESKWGRWLRSFRSLVPGKPLAERSAKGTSAAKSSPSEQLHQSCSHGRRPSTGTPFRLSISFQALPIVSSILSFCSTSFLSGEPNLRLVSHSFSMPRMRA